MRISQLLLGFGPALSVVIILSKTPPKKLTLPLSVGYHSQITSWLRVELFPYALLVAPPFSLPYPVFHYSPHLNLF